MPVFATREGRRHAWAILALAAASAALYAPALRGGWVWDDAMLVRPSPALRDLDGLRRAVSTDLYRQADPGVEESAYWRPLALASYWADTRLGSAPGALHAGNLILHVLAASLVGLAILRRTGASAGPWPALAAGAWWAFHPEQVEAVAWISCRYDLLVAVALAALLAVPWRPGWGRAAVHGLLFLAGLLSKDGFAVLAAVIVADDLAERRPAALAAPRWAAVAAAIALWLSLRAALGLQGFSAQEARGLPRMLLEVVGTYTGRAVAPLPLTTGHLHVPSAGIAALGAAVLVALGAAVALRRGLAVPVAAFVAGLVPAAVALANFGETPERYFYVPSIGLALLAGDTLAACRSSRRPAVRRGALAATGALALLGVPAVFARVPEWRSDATLFSAALRVDGADPVANLHLGLAAARAGDWREARERLEVGQRRDPRSGRIATALAWVLLGSGAEDALAQAERATRVGPDMPHAWHLLAVARHRAGDHRGELAALDRLLRLSPSFPGAADARAAAECEVSGRQGCARGSVEPAGP